MDQPPDAMVHSIVSLLSEKGLAFKVTDNSIIDTSDRTNKRDVGIPTFIAEFENDRARTADE